jgi:hypothetical protein
MCMRNGNSKLCDLWNILGKLVSQEGVIVDPFVGVCEFGSEDADSNLRTDAN